MKSSHQGVTKSTRKAVKAAILCVLSVVFLFGSELEVSHLRRGLAGPSFPARPLLTNETDPFVQSPFNQINPHGHSWCPSAKCHNSPMCSPCNRRYLFIVAMDSSESTTLLKLLNLLPNVRLSGENNNELYVASLIESNLRRSSLLDYDTEIEGTAWVHHKIPNQSLACPIQQVVSTLTPPPSEVLHAVNETGAPSLDDYDQSTILGLKTIHIQNSDWPAYKAAAFFKENFPCSRIVVNLRWSESRAGEFKFLNFFADHLGPDTVKLVLGGMTEWTKGGTVPVLNDLLDWLGYKECTIVHENRDGYDLDWTDPQISEECYYPH